MSTVLVIAVAVLVFLVIFQIAKASEYVAILKGEDRSRKENNKINGFFMITFLIAGLIGVYYCNELLVDKTLFAQPSASVQGERVDDMMKLTLVITGIVFVLTQIALFVFAYKYQENDNRKVFFFPHNNTMEIIWTVIPAIALTVLVVIGLRNWFFFTSDAPKESAVVEVTGKQFGWIFRYAGEDGVFGKKYYRMIDPANNSLGLNWRDSADINIKDDPAAHDDIVQDQTMYVVKEKPVKLIINSRDVIHDVGLSAFRLKMDAVPGTPTTLWFTPKYTTKEMREITGNPNYQYEISCDQMCGNGHYSMKGIIEVVTQAEYDEWQAKQKPAYYAAFPDKDPSNQQQAVPVAVDSAKKVTALSSAKSISTASN
ncbi:cytochrome c oxidase subunit II [Limnovirga soli]|jgi:cytochrome c oxidase subunit 2|uniref:Cytochrome c oxidase subunit 2 n=1 Tax=Limnovirga soli TaxID=2656915 RepID=A0A8J8JXK1_9BACT|nr:cytochrome c oxidase subunit II [Limnovirga soli]NNV56421.1 cytochrome c oxidase subunit II [Limnovirga soli]